MALAREVERHIRRHSLARHVGHHNPRIPPARETPPNSVQHWRDVAAPRIIFHHFGLVHQPIGRIGYRQLADQRHDRALKID